MLRLAVAALWVLNVSPSAIEGPRTAAGEVAKVDDRAVAESELDTAPIPEVAELTAPVTGPHLKKCGGFDERGSLGNGATNYFSWCNLAFLYANHRNISLVGVSTGIGTFDGALHSCYGVGYCRLSVRRIQPTH